MREREGMMEREGRGRGSVGKGGRREEIANVEEGRKKKRERGKGGGKRRE